MPRASTTSSGSGIRERAPAASAPFEGVAVTHQPMKGVKMVEVAQFTFTPAAGAVLTDWGADVIKVEHAVAGDAQRGLRLGTGGVAVGSFQPLMEHPNRGKRSIGLALDNPEAHAV